MSKIIINATYDKDSKLLTIFPTRNQSKEFKLNSAWMAHKDPPTSWNTKIVKVTRSTSSDEKRKLSSLLRGAIDGVLSLDVEFSDLSKDRGEIVF